MPTGVAASPASRDARVEADLARLAALDLVGLRQRWRRMVGRPVPDHLHRHLLHRLLAYRIQAAAFGDLDRETARMTHPMDNGLIANVPVFIVETLDIADAAGATLAALTLSEAISDDPTLTLLLDTPAGGEALVVAARDTGGSTFRARVPIPEPVPPGTTSEPAPARHLEGQL